jgi:hypothetical protein
LIFVVVDISFVVNCGTFSLPFTSGYYGVECCGRVPRKVDFVKFFNSLGKQKKKVGKSGGSVETLLFFFVDGGVRHETMKLAHLLIPTVFSRPIFVFKTV